jgi:pyruvate/2-oxoglutarate dehydrogenase complex dihydrolipoamide dehydrogenase (E3) component
MPDRFDLIAIGGGTAGLVTAAGAAYLGARAALVERHRLGGDCLWTGCVPSKALIASAQAAAIRRNSEALGLSGGVPAEPDFAAVMASMREARDLAGRPDDPERFRRLGVEVVFGEAEFDSDGTVRVGDRVLRARRIVIATGSRPGIPPIPGLETAGYLTHETVFDLAAAPASVALIGGGPIGVEFAQIFQRLGVPVTLFEALPRILPREDPEAAEVVRQALEAEGVVLHTGVAIRRIEAAPGGKAVIWQRGASPEQRTTVHTLFVAAGRLPRTEGLGLERLGVAIERGAVRVDRTLRTTRPGVWAAGDVTGGPQFTHVADYHARLVVRNALVPGPRARVDYRAVPWVTYSDPEVARVGLSETEAEELGLRSRVWRYDFAELDRAITDRRREGFVKLVATPGGRMLGATIVGNGAGNLIPLIAVAMRRRLPLSALTQFVYPYPTMSEGILRAATLSRRAQLDSWPGRLLKRIVRWGL